MQSVYCPCNLSVYNDQCITNNSHSITLYIEADLVCIGVINAVSVLPLIKCIINNSHTLGVY